MPGHELLAVKMAYGRAGFLAREGCPEPPRSMQEPPRALTLCLHWAMLLK